MTEKAKKEIIITSVLAVFMVFMVVRAIGQVKKYKRPAAPRPASLAATQPGPAPSARDKKTVAEKKKDFAQAQKAKDAFFRIYDEVKDVKITRDPFTVAAADAGEGVAPSDLSLYGIIWDDLKPIAVINEEMVSVGDRIGKSTVVSIEKDSVTVNDGTRDFKLLLN